ncbi:MAG: D-alanine--D-alanine ligase [Clostridia bacterium]|nr:D-alanine--D-alanine ligase [Clostridia bacterium]
MLNLLIIFGGASGEHEVSCLSAASVLRNINKDKYYVTKIGITKDGRWFKTDASADKIENGEWINEDNIKAILSPDRETHGIVLADGTVQKIDVIFPVMHGDFCEDGCIQGLFELAGIPYVGPGVLSSSVSMDKAATKLFVEKLGIRQAAWYVASPDFTDEDIDKITAKFNFPVFVKPCNAGSSLGAGKASNREELVCAIREAAKVDSKILCEEFIDAREIECAVLGNRDAKASTVGEILPSNEFYDYNAKYIDNKSGLVIPADLPEKTAEEIRTYAVKIFKALQCRCLSRVDFFVHKKTGEVYFNEINTLPGFTSISMYPKLWGASGIPYSELIDKLIEYAQKL